MRLTKKGEYALRALISLGVAQAAGRPLIAVSELVQKENLPKKFVEKILSQLGAHGYVGARRGHCGGYYLRRPASHITFGEVIRLIDGPLAPIACVSKVAYRRCTCPDEQHCGLRMLMLDVRGALTRILDSYSLADLVKLTLDHRQKTGVPSPFAFAGPPPPIGLDMPIIPDALSSWLDFKP